MRTPALIAVLFCFAGCSFTHIVSLENRSSEPVTIAYKLEFFSIPISRNHAHPGFFTTRPGIERKQGSDFVPDTTVRVNPADSVVTFTLAPGERAAIARCVNCTYEGMSDGGGGYAYNRMNMEWLNVTRAGTTTTYTALSLLELAQQQKTHATLFVIE